MEAMDHTPRVILVDDDVFVRRVLARMLRVRGWTVEEVAGGADALALVERHPPDVVLTDLRMPGMDGVALVEALRRRFPGLPVLVMAGSAELSSAGRAMRAGAVDYLPKPVELEAVLSALARVLDRGRPDAEVQGLRLQREITAALADPRLDVAAILETLTQRTAESFGELCVLRLLSKDGEQLVPGVFHHPRADARAMLEEPLRRPWPTSERLLAEVLAPGRAIVGQPAADQMRRFCAVNGMTAYIERFGITSVVLAPLRGRGAPLGLLACLRGPAERPYGERELMLLESLAARASFAVENARLESQLEEQLRQTDRPAAADEEKSERPSKASAGPTSDVREVVDGGDPGKALTRDFDEMLSVVIGCATRLLQEEEMSEGARARIHSILRAARHGVALTTQLEALARPRAREVPCSIPREPRVPDALDAPEHREDR